MTKKQDRTLAFLIVGAALSWAYIATVNAKAAEARARIFGA